MNVQVRHFAVLREKRGLAEEVVSLPEGTTVGELYERLFPGDPLRVLFAVNRAYARADTRLREGDEVAFVPPLGGG